MRTNFAPYFFTSRPRFPNQSNTFSRTEVLTMNAVIAKFREQNFAHDYGFFANRGPSGEAKKRAPITLMHNSVADQIVILTMVEQRHPNHPRIFHRAPHNLVVLYTMAVICYGHNARLCK